MKRLWGGLVLGAAALGVAACGGDGGGDAGALVDATADPDAARVDGSIERLDGGSGGPDASSIDGGTRPTDVLRAVAGEPTASAAASLPRFGPVISRLEPDDDERIRDRITVVLRPEVTVASLNEALARHDLGIALSMPPSLVLSLATPMLDRAGAESIIASLAAAELIAAGWPAYAMSTDDNPQARGRLPADENELTVLELAPHLTGPRFPAMWNAASLATERVRVIVPDTFYEASGGTPSVPASVPSLRFAAGSRGVAQSTRAHFHTGNHGYWVTGILGATWDELVPTGTVPDATRLEIVGVDAAHPSVHEVLALVAAEFPDAGPSIVSASWGYNDVELDRHPLIERATAALSWRMWLEASANRPLMIASAGNDGDEVAPPSADLNSPITTQTRIGDLRGLFARRPIDDPERVAFDLEWNAVTGTIDDLDGPIGDTIIVGSSSQSGAPSDSSTPDEDVRMVGEQPTGVCMVADDLCSLANPIYALDGTSGATPALAGAAAFLWSIDPSASTEDLRDALVNAETDDERWVDVYDALLAFEHAGGPPIRRAIVDVAGGIDGRGDGRFDEDDVAAILEAVTASDAQPDRNDWSRFDLDGDGHTGTRHTHAMDLDDDGLVDGVFVELESDRRIRFDEARLSDLEVLCYLAFSARYTGNTTTRETVLAEACADLDVGGTPTLAEYEGTVRYTTTIVANPMPESVCGMPGARRTTTRTVQAMVHCPAFDPRAGVTTCSLVDATATVMIDQPAGPTPWAATREVFGTPACTTDGDPACGSDTRCISQARCALDDAPVDSTMGRCSPCEAYRRTVVTANTSRTISSLAAFAGSAVVTLGTSGGLAVARFSPFGVNVQVLGSSAVTTVTAGDCTETPGTNTVPLIFEVPLASGLDDVGFAIQIGADGSVSASHAGSETLGTTPATETMRSWDIAIDIHPI